STLHRSRAPSLKRNSPELQESSLGLEGRARKLPISRDNEALWARQCLCQCGAHPMVLLVDPDRLYRLAAEYGLAAAGFDTKAVSDARTASAVLDPSRVQVALIDARATLSAEFPKLARELTHYGVRVVVLTNGTGPAARAPFLGADASAKPMAI